MGDEGAVYRGPVARATVDLREGRIESMTLIGVSKKKLEASQRIRAVRVSIAASLFVALIELSIGWILDLESLIAEGLHTFVDGAGSFIVLYAVMKAAEPADEEHPFGHGKFEALGAAVEGAFVLCAGVGIAYRAGARLFLSEMPERIPVYVCIIMAATAVFYLLVSSYLMRIARKTHSPAVLAEALHLRTHIYIVGGLAAGLLVGHLGGWMVADTVLALVVAVCLVGIAMRILREVWRQFTDEALPPEELERLSSIIGQFEGRYVNVHDVRTRQAGAERQIEMHLVVLPETTVRDAHALCECIERAVAAVWPNARATIHIEPQGMPSHEQAL